MKFLVLNVHDVFLNDGKLIILVIYIDNHTRNPPIVIAWLDENISN